MNDAFETLQATLDQVWNRIGRGVADAKSPMRTPVLATVSTQGPDARMVVVRKADRSASQLVVHTDARTAKVAHLQGNPNATFLFWDQKARLQVRVGVRVEVAPGGPDDWAKVPASSRNAYGATPAPAAAIDAPFQPSGGDLAFFTVLTCSVRQIETLHLGRAMHRRAMFHAPDWQGQWLAP